MTRHTPTRRDVLDRLGTAGAVGIGVAIAGCSGDGGGGGGDDDTIDMTDDLAFEPSSLTVSAGTTVTWDNVGSIGHSVTAYADGVPSDATYFASGGFDSESAARDGYADGEGVIEGGETYEHTFETAGSYEYFCIPHEQSGMTGTITVE